MRKLLLTSTCLLLPVLAAPAQATVYDYTGAPFTLGTCQSGIIVTCHNPGPTVLTGTEPGITGSIATTFDTSHFTGALDQSDIASGALFSAVTPPIADLPGAVFVAALTLDDGAITAWNVSWSFHPIDSTGRDLLAISSSTGDMAFTGDYGYGLSASTPTPGTWSAPAETPLPASLLLFVSGMAVLGFTGWRRWRGGALA